MGSRLIVVGFSYMKGRTMDFVNNEERFIVKYKIQASSYEEAKAIAFSVQVEQTVEFPYDYLANDWFKDTVVGQLISLDKIAENSYLASISYLVSLTSLEVTQFMNIVYGNSSLQPNICVVDIELSESLIDKFKGPRFGLEGLREYLNVPKRAMLQAVIKPMGSSVETLTKMCEAYALGGVDVIKDDHGITNQIHAPFEERVKACAEAVANSNAKTGKKTIFAANVSADGNETIERAYRAKELGATGLMVAPALVGFSMLNKLATDENLNLPIISHPAFSGGFVMNQNSGIDFTTWFGLLNRIFGADMSIFVSYGGRFTFKPEQCQDVIKKALGENFKMKKTIPAPGGGVTEARLPELMNIYGQDVMYLVGGDMFRRGNDLRANSAHFMNILENAAK